jgi:hypothetical protein
MSILFYGCAELAFTMQVIDKCNVYNLIWSGGIRSYDGNAPKGAPIFHVIIQINSSNAS